MLLGLSTLISRYSRCLHLTINHNVLIQALIQRINQSFTCYYRIDQSTVSMSPVQKTPMSDPLRPRPINLSTLPVTPVRLVAQFDDSSDDICLTELVARATDAAAMFNANKFPLPFDSDDGDAGANPDPLKFLPAPLQDLPDVSD